MGEIFIAARADGAVVENRIETRKGKSLISCLLNTPYVHVYTILVQNQLYCDPFLIIFVLFTNY